MPAAKKDPSVRARANRAATAATLGSESVVPLAQRPELPERTDKDGNALAWHQLTLEWWRDLWAAPMAGEYHSSDRHGLFVLAGLMEDFWRAGSPTMRTTVAMEIRLQRQAFGLTPYDRRRLEWTIESVHEAQDRGRSRRQRATTPAPVAGADPRSALRAV